MELKVDMPSLAGQDIDPETFQRVWNRVMPDQAAPEPPASIPDTAVPAEPSAPPEEVPPSQPDLPPVPDCPAQPECPECPPAQECPECPACPECPPQVECPACPECPAVPEPAPTPEAPALCLGEASQGDSGRLEALMTLARTGSIAGQALSRRASGACAKTLSALAQDHRSAFRRLSAAYFLINGKRFSPKCPALDLPASLPLALRQQFVWEQQWERQNRQAAQATADSCLKELYLELAQEGALHAGCIRSLLEQMA